MLRDSMKRPVEEKIINPVYDQSKADKSKDSRYHGNMVDDIRRVISG